MQQDFTHRAVFPRRRRHTLHPPPPGALCVCPSPDGGLTARRLSIWRQTPRAVDAGGAWFVLTGRL